MNKIIWMYWAQGWTKIPDVVRWCVRSWEHYNTNWDIRFLDDSNLADYFDYDEWKNKSRRPRKTIEYPAKSDIIRMNLLQRYGGVWADATLWCHKPLDDWLSEYMVSDFFAFSNPTEDRLIAPWFIVSSKDEYMINAYNEKVREYWNNRKTLGCYSDSTIKDYYWVHGLFGDLYETDLTFKALWDDVPKIECSIDGGGNHPHLFVDSWRCPQARRNRKVTAEFMGMIDSHEIPIYKLTRHNNTTQEQMRFKNLGNLPKVKYLFNTIG